MRLSLVLFLFFYVNVTFSQSYEYEYEYDDAGNRTARLVIPLSNNSFQSTQSANGSNENQDTITTQIAGLECIVYPNPTREVLYLEIIGDFEGEIYCQVSDLKGQQLIVKSCEQKNMNFDFSSFKAGAYILFVQNKNRKSTIKVIKY